MSKILSTASGYIVFHATVEMIDILEEFCDEDDMVEEIESFIDTFGSVFDVEMLVDVDEDASSVIHMGKICSENKGEIAWSDIRSMSDHIEEHAQNYAAENALEAFLSNPDAVDDPRVGELLAEHESLMEEGREEWAQECKKIRAVATRVLESSTITYPMIQEICDIVITQELAYMDVDDFKKEYGIIFAEDEDGIIDYLNLKYGSDMSLWEESIRIKHEEGCRKVCRDLIRKFSYGI